MGSVRQSVHQYMGRQQKQKIENCTNARRERHHEINERTISDDGVLVSLSCEGVV